MPIVSIGAAKTHLSRLVHQAAAGDEIIIAKAGAPLAKLGPLVPAGRRMRHLGILAGRMTVPVDVDAPLPDHVLDAFAGH